MAIFLGGGICGSEALLVIGDLEACWHHVSVILEFLEADGKQLGWTVSKGRYCRGPDIWERHTSWHVSESYGLLQTGDMVLP